MHAFTYWDEDDISTLDAVSGEWRRHVPDFCVILRDEVRAILAKIEPSFLNTFDRITIPAARSDLARLLALHERGGLYVDSHCGVTDAEALGAILKQADAGALILVDEATSRTPRPKGRLHLINAMMACGPGDPFVRDLVGAVIANFEGVRQAEECRGFEPYDLLHLSGPFVITAAAVLAGRTIRSDLAARTVVMREEHFPVRRGAFAFERKAAHWSTRQRTERLFR